MKNLLISTVLAVALVGTALAQKPSEYLSLRLEMERAIRKANNFLKSQQDEEGFWGEKETPALTALVLSSALRDPGLENRSELPAYLEKGYDWLLKQQKDDGDRGDSSNGPGH